MSAEQTSGGAAEKAADAAELAKGLSTDREFQLAIESAIPSFGISIFLWLHWHYFKEHMVGMKSKCMFGDTKLAELGIIVGIYIVLILVIAAALALLVALVQVLTNPMEIIKLIGQAAYHKLTGQ